MENFERKFNTPEEAQAFLKSVSERVENSCLQMEFTAAFVEAQAAMVDWLIKEAHFIDIQRKEYMDGDFREGNRQIELACAWDDYNSASLEFQMAKIKMQKIIDQLPD